MKSSTTVIAARSISTADERRCSPATGWIGPSALPRLPARSPYQVEAIIDGEVVVVHEGRTNFSELQAELAAGRQGRLVYYAFDLLWRDGDLRKRPQIERKQALLDLLGENDIELPVLFSEHLVATVRRCLSMRPS